MNTLEQVFCEHESLLLLNENPAAAISGHTIHGVGLTVLEIAMNLFLTSAFLQNCEMGFTRLHNQ